MRSTHYVPGLRIITEHLVFTEASYRERDMGHHLVAEIGVAIWLLAGMDAVEEIVHMLLIAFVAHTGDDHLILAPFQLEILLEGRVRHDARIVDVASLWPFPLIAQ